MATPLGSLRRLVLAPSLHSVSFAGRKFPVTRTPATDRLEMIPQSVVVGFEWGIESRGTAEVEQRLAMVEPEMRGFAYEGAAMAFTVRDAIRGHRTGELILGSGRPHFFLAYIGIGFAMARLPRPLWRKILPDLSDIPFHPTMSWLAVDGYGFDLAYFHTARWVDQQQRPVPYPWEGHPGYFLRAVDQGIGRALWFIHGGRPTAVAAAVARFAEDRRADLWSGVGLAATFAGGATAAELGRMRDTAARDGYAGDLAVGAVFAVKARHYADFVPGHTVAAASALTGLRIEEAVDLADRTEVERTGTGPEPQYELWRRNIRTQWLSTVVTPSHKE
ncbi:enediyne biosynthesis protein [Streptomyces sp. CB01249]|uniref:DUF1702 family protein n=1 Tax=Streptomyces sp. CB01249 TaxID=1703929 RepID=UPI00093FBD2D|nr:DUF1702 family protein [Streptomyces sp. CB01249]OKI91996.1 enediyne biosynthesis protein [Streptomyces sp. CB01249]